MLEWPLGGDPAQTCNGKGHKEQFPGKALNEMNFQMQKMNPTNDSLMVVC
jgi:hypothetical protein